MESSAVSGIMFSGSTAVENAPPNEGAVAHRFSRKCSSLFQNQTYNQTIQKSMCNSPFLLCLPLSNVRARTVQDSNSDNDRGLQKHLPRAMPPDGLIFCVTKRDRPSLFAEKICLVRSSDILYVTAPNSRSCSPARRYAGRPCTWGSRGCRSWRSPAGWRGRRWT